MAKQKNGPEPKPGAAPESTTTSTHHSARACSNDTGLPGHARWRNQVRRMRRLDCGCRDVCHCTTPPLSDSQLDGWALAAGYVLATTGQIPMLPVEVLRALYRRGGDDRALAEKLHAAGGAA